VIIIIYRSFDFLNDIFYYIENADICNFADDNIIYKYGINIDIVMESLKSDLSIVLRWFFSNATGG